MNPWPDDYTEPPTEQDAVKAWQQLAGGLGGPAAHVLGRYLHHLTQENRGLQAVIDDQWAEIHELEMEVEAIDASPATNDVVGAEATGIWEADG